MRLSPRHLVPLAAIVAIAVSALSLSDDGDAQASDGTTFYQGTGDGQPAYFFFDGSDTARVADDAAGVCDDNPQLEARMGTQDAGQRRQTCGTLLASCPSTAASTLLGITVAPGKDPATVTAHSTCWSYPAGVSIERPAPAVPQPDMGSDPAFSITQDGQTFRHEYLWLATPGGPKSGTEVRASYETVDGSVVLHSLGVAIGGDDVPEAASLSFEYIDRKDGNPRWAEISSDLQWITTELPDGLRLDPQICLDSGICQKASTIAYVGAHGEALTAQVLAWK